MEILREPPNAASFVPLVVHQSTTPASFYTGPPVLHYYSDRSKVIVLQSELSNAPAFSPLFSSADNTVQTAPEQHQQANGDSDVQKVVNEVDVWVTSDKLFLYSSSANAGVSIPYPTISLHAIQTLPTPSPDTTEQGVYMQLITSTDEASSEDLGSDSISMTIIPTASAPPGPQTQLDGELETEDRPEQTPVQALFHALSDCANLHPDASNEGDEEEGASRLIQAGLAMPGDDSGGLPPPMPGSGGWITAENMHEFIDEDGNWIQDDDIGDDGQSNEPLGPGAGSVRAREDRQGGGEPDGGDDTKWQRTS